MSKPRYKAAFYIIMAFISCSVLLYFLFSNSPVKVMSLPVSIFLLWLLQAVAAILAWVLLKKIFKFDE